MSSHHPWSLFARSAGQHGPTEKAACTNPCDGNSSDEDQDIPTMSPSTTPAIGSQGSLTSRTHSAIPGESSSKSLASSCSPEAGIRGDFENAGMSEWLISRVEDMLMDHFYRVEASVFKVECGLKAQVQVCEEQQRYMHDVNERLMQVSSDQRTDRARVQEIRQEQSRLRQSDSATTQSSSTSSTTLSKKEKTDQSQAVSSLQQDFDQQLARHEDRFASFERTLRQCSDELAQLRSAFQSAQSSSKRSSTLQLHDVVGAASGFALQPSQSKLPSSLTDQAEGIPERQGYQSCQNGPLPLDPGSSEGAQRHQAGRPGGSRSPVFSLTNEKRLESQS